MLLKSALLFFVVASVAAILALGDAAAAYAPLARKIFMISMGLFIVSTIAHAFRKRTPKL